MYRAAVLLCVGCFANGSLKHGAAYGVDSGAILVSAFKMIRAPSLESCAGLDNTPPVTNPDFPSAPYTTPYSVCQDHNHEHRETMLVGSIVIAAALAGGLVNYLFFDAPPEQKNDDTLAPLEETHDRLEVQMMEFSTPSIPLMQLTRQAALAAREHHCKAVKAIAKRVQQIDDAYVRTGFVTDAAIKACLEEGTSTVDTKKAAPAEKPADKGEAPPADSKMPLAPPNEAAHGKQ
jgi:hypothetical protein